MSRWNDQFEAHAFQTTWSTLKASLTEATVDDETVLTSVSELARLKKVVEYLDGMIQGIDPEITPLAILDSCNAQATPCLQQIDAYNSNRNIAHVTKANAHIDNLLTYIRPYMVLPKEAAASIKRAATKYSNFIEEYITSFQTKASQLISDIKSSQIKADEQTSLITDTKQTIDDLSFELFGEDGSSGIQSKISKLVVDFNKEYDSINEFYNETLVDNGDVISTKKQITSAKELILEEQAKIEKLLSLVSTDIEALEKFHKKIFGELDEKQEHVVPGLAGELETRMNQLTAFEKQQKTKYNALNEEIEALLPGATSAGLATAYKDLKISFDIPIANASKLFYSAIGIIWSVNTF